MNVAEITKKMIAYSQGNVHDISHFLKVYAYAKTIGECEGLEEQTQTVLEVAALVHDIACPLCRKKYGNANGKDQEKEGAPLARVFLRDTGLSEDMIARISYLVGHHHTLTDINGMDYQILIEADYLVNAEENGYSMENIQRTRNQIFKTTAGKALLNSIYGTLPEAQQEGAVV